MTLRTTGTAAEVAGNHAERFRARGDRCRAGLIKFPHAFRDIRATQQLGRALGGELVARAVKTPAVHADVIAALPQIGIYVP